MSVRKKENKWVSAIVSSERESEWGVSVRKRERDVVTEWMSEWVNERVSTCERMRDLVNEWVSEQWGSCWDISIIE